MDLKDRFLGTILGCAVGDALGAPFEGRSRSFMQRLSDLTDAFEKVPGYPLGQYTDDTQMTLALIESIINKRGIDGGDIAYRFANLWRNNTIIGSGASCRDAMINMLVNDTRWDEAGVEEGRAGNGTAMRTSPIGLFNHNDAIAVRKDAITQSIITHKDKRASAGAVSVSAAVYYSINNEKIDPAPFLDFVLETITGLSEEFSEAITELKEIITVGEEEAFTRIASRCYKSSNILSCITPYVIPTVMAAFYHFLKSPDNWELSVTGALKCGGDTDTITSITGAVSGSFNGYQVIPEQLVEDLVDREYIEGITLKLHEVSVA